MSDRLARIRRILSDHGPAVRRASETPPPPAASPPSPGAGDLLRARLAALGAQRRAAFAARPADGGNSDGTPTTALPLALPAEDGRTLEERTGATLRHSPRGAFLVGERRISLANEPGPGGLRDAFARPIRLRRRERRPGGRTEILPAEAVFLDVETTGLSGGTGTIAFLIGAGRLEGDAFVVRQYFLRDFPDEAAVLETLAWDLGDAPWITFNGRSFDVPLLATRFRLHRLPFPERDHLDLLPPARRLWAGSLASHALGELERAVLDVHRVEDLPGALMPAAYFAWLREGRSAGVSLAFRHNEADIVSLAALGGVVSRLLEDPSSRPAAPWRDHLDTARLLLDHGDLPRARACLEGALRALAAPTRAPLRRLLGDLHRRAGDLDAAERLWRDWIAEGDPADAHPFVEAAKLLEHRRRDPGAALALVEEALARDGWTPLERDGLERRAARLRRRLVALAARPRTPPVPRKPRWTPTRPPAP